MTHEEIDAMPAGPELDALACEALGVEPAYDWWVVNKNNNGLVIKGSEIFSSGTHEQRCEIWCRQHDTDTYEPRVFARWRAISSATDEALLAMGTKPGMALLYGVDRDGEWLAKTAFPYNDAVADTPALAIARAIAKGGLAK